VAVSAVLGLRGDVQLVLRNVTKGAAAVLAHRAQLTALRVCRWSARGAAGPRLALVYAALLVQRSDKTRKRFAQVSQLAYHQRRLMLFALERCVEKGLVPEEKLAPVRDGSGPVDAAGDCLALVALFGEYAAALAGRTPVEAAD